MSATAAQLPIVKIAAGAVIVLSAVGVGVMTGLIPGVASNDRAAIEAQAPAETAQATPAAQPTPVKPVVKQRVASAPVRQAKSAAPVCADCGVVESVRAVEMKGEASGAGAVAGAVGGLIVGNQIGSGRGKTLAKVAGAAGGAYAGHQIEKNMRKTTQYEVALRMDDGSRRTVTQASGEGLSVGARVRVMEGAVVPN
jgi:outer membrane lipoprotein SlyB